MAFSAQQTVTEPSDPVVFGITFTPPILGGVLAVAGVIGGVALLVQVVMPQYQTYLDLQAKVAEKQARLDRVAEEKQKVQKTLNDLERARATQAQVLALFPAPTTLSVLPVDLNRIVTEQFGQMTKLEAGKDGLMLVSDDSWGEAVKEKIRQQVFQVGFEADYDRTNNILRNLERYQSMLAIDNLSSELKLSKQPVRFDEKTGQFVAQGTPQIRIATSFSLKVLLPLSAQELAQKAAAAAEGEKKEGEGAAAEPAK
jgi:type IV pilus assembly protein PilO